ncbi:MAG: AMP-binding protein [Chloroflexi bacterium]|nr:AMP-binding protein [Chloroflexota bacterium]
MSAGDSMPISFGRRLGMLADEHPEHTAIIFVPRSGDERRLSWLELDRASNRVARLLAAQGVDARSTVVVGLPNGPEHYITTFAVWKLGALPLVLRPALPDRERDAVLDLARPALIVADWAGAAYPTLQPGKLCRAQRFSDRALPDRISNPGRALASGGSTGRPKIIVSPGPWTRVPGAPVPFLGAAGFGMCHTQLVSGPLYHSAPFLTSYHGLFDDNTLVVLEKFDAARAVELIEQHRVQSMYLPPILMQRIAALPDVQARDLSSLQAVASSAAPCPPWLKRVWIDLVGARHVTEVFSATEGIGRTVIRGDEWLTHPGSVGRPFATELRILDDAERDLPPGEIGQIFMRPQQRVAETYRYLGAAPATTTPDGFVSVGDLGWVDEAGYLFVADRRTDLIITGGANVYPAEVEAALTEHPAVADVVVIGVPDAEWGKRVHAVVQPRLADHPPSVAVLDAHCRERLAAYKAPKTYEFLVDLPRNDAGKIQRSALAAARASGWVAGMIAVKPGMIDRGRT